MIKKLFCFLWGCRIWEKAFTGKTLEVTNIMGMYIDIPLYKKQYNQVCPRYGRELIKEVKS